MPFVPAWGKLHQQFGLTPLEKPARVLLVQQELSDPNMRNHDISGWHGLSGCIIFAMIADHTRPATLETARKVIDDIKADLSLAESRNRRLETAFRRLAEHVVESEVLLGLFAPEQV